MHICLQCYFIKQCIKTYIGFGLHDTCFSTGRSLLKGGYLSFNPRTFKPRTRECVSQDTQSMIRPSYKLKTNHHMPCTAQLVGSVLKTSWRVQYTPFGPGDKSPIITDQHRAGGSVSQLSQLTKLWPWLTLSTNDIAVSFWHDSKWFWLLSYQIMGSYHFSNTTKSNLCIYDEKRKVDYLRSRIKERVNLLACLIDLNWPQPSPILGVGGLLMRTSSGAGLLMIIWGLGLLMRNPSGTGLLMIIRDLFINTNKWMYQGNKEMSVSGVIFNELTMYE